MSMKVRSLIEETRGMMDNYNSKPIPYFAPPEPVVIEQPKIIPQIIAPPV